MVQIYLDALDSSCNVSLDPTIETVVAPEYDIEATFYIPTDKLQKMFQFRNDLSLNSVDYITRIDASFELNAGLATVYDAPGYTHSSVPFVSDHTEYPQIRSVASDYIRFLSTQIFCDLSGADVVPAPISAVALLTNKAELEDDVWVKSNAIWLTQKASIFEQLGGSGGSIESDTSGNSILVGNDSNTGNEICKKIYKTLVIDGGGRFAASAATHGTIESMPFLVYDELCYKVTLGVTDNVWSMISTVLNPELSTRTKAILERRYLIRIVASDDPAHLQSAMTLELQEVTDTSSVFYSNILKYLLLMSAGERTGIFYNVW